MLEGIVSVKRFSNLIAIGALSKENNGKPISRSQIEGRARQNDDAGHTGAANSLRELLDANPTRKEFTPNDV
jgi:hypothetical protein